MRIARWVESWVRYLERCSLSVYDVGYRVQGSISQVGINGYYSHTDKNHNGFPLYKKAGGHYAEKLLYWSCKDGGRWCICDTVSECQAKGAVGQQGSTGPTKNDWSTWNKEWALESEVLVTGRTIQELFSTIYFHHVGFC